MELDDITPDDVYAYINSSFLPELTFLTIVVLIVGLAYHWPALKTRFLLEDNGGHFPIPYLDNLTKTPPNNRKSSRKYRRVTELRNRRARSREYILGRPLRKPSFSIIQESS